VVFEFDKTGNGVTSGRIAMDISAANFSADQIAQLVVDTINAQTTTLLITATKQGTSGSVSLVNDVATSLGNQTIGLSFSAGGNGWARTGMAGGAGANCGAALGCATTADCAPPLTCQGATTKTCQ